MITEQEDLKNLTICVESAKVVASMMTAALASWFGFLAACKRDDLRKIRGCIAKILFWRNKIEALRDHTAICQTYEESVTVIHESVIDAMMLFSKKRQKLIQIAWDNYRLLKPRFKRPEDFLDPDIPTDILPVDRSSESGYYAVLRTLDALKNSIQE
jgi:hypothetical protein